MLSDEQIDAITDAQWGNKAEYLHAAYRAYARAIESAAYAERDKRIAELEHACRYTSDLCTQAIEARAELERELEKIKRVGSCGSVDSWMLLTDQQKRNWFAVMLNRDTQQCITIQQQAEELEAVRKDAQWRPIKTAPKNGETILILLDASDVPHAARWYELHENGSGWYLVWDHYKISAADAPRYWIPILDDPDEAAIDAAKETN